MSFNDIGKYSDFIKGIKSIDNTLDVVKQGQAISTLLKDVSTLDDASKILQLSGVSKEVGEAALKSSQFASELDKVVDSSTGLTAGKKAIADLSKEGKTASNIFKGLGSTLMSLAPALAAIATASVAFYALSKYVTAFG